MQRTIALFIEHNPRAYATQARRIRSWHVLVDAGQRSLFTTPLVDLGDM
jgi:hypothetical protein